MINSESPNRFSLKDHLFNRESVTFLASLFHAAEPSFPMTEFINAVMVRLSDLELKERIVYIADVLGQYLPTEFEHAASMIRSALPPRLDPDLADNDFGDFIIAPLGEFVARNGLAPVDYDTSMALLHQITMRFSMEGPIRAFIDAYPEQTMNRLNIWAFDPNYHVRRLVSEGTRPLLPWAKRISLDPTKTIPLLDILHADPTRYVTRSVANHLNDLTKSEPGLVIATLEHWQKWGKQKRPELDWMTRHTLRTLVKKGDSDALAFLGYAPDPDISVGPIQIIEPLGTIRIGDILRFTLSITAHRDEQLLVDYLIEFANEGRPPRSKVFKLKSVNLVAGETVDLVKTHPLRGGASTFTLYPGRHQLILQINGRPFSSLEFELEA